MAVSGDFTVSCGTCETYQVTTNSENVVDDLFWTRGKHHFGFGGNYIHNHMNLQGTNNANGQFSFNGSFTGDALADFMLGDLYSLYQGNDTGSTFAKNVFAFYGQDSYQVTPRLTVNAGVRWESDLPEVETAGRGDASRCLRSLPEPRPDVFKTAPPGLLFAGDPGIPKGYINNHWDHFEPRFGIAWDPRGKGQESIRASYTFGFSQPIVYMEDRYENNAPYGDAITINPPAGTLSNPYAAYPGGNPFPQPYPPPKTAPSFPRRLLLRVPCEHEAELHADLESRLEKQLGASWEVTAAYLGNHRCAHPFGQRGESGDLYSRHLDRPGNLRFAHHFARSTAQPARAPANTNARRATALANPVTGAYYSEISYMYDGSSSIYDGMLLTVQHRFAQHFTLLTNYTWSKCITGGTDVGDLGGNTFQNPADPGADRSNCGEDLRNNFITSLVARSDLKSGGLKQALLGGWQVAPIVTVILGARVSPTTGTDASLTGVNVDRPNLVGDPYVHGQARKYWLNPASFQKNAPGTYGNTKPYSLVGPTVRRSRRGDQPLLPAPGNHAARVSRGVLQLPEPSQPAGPNGGAQQLSLRPDHRPAESAFS